MTTLKFVSRQTIDSSDIRGILDAYNEIAHEVGIGGRMAFRDKSCAVKAYEGLRSQYAGIDWGKGSS